MEPNAQPQTPSDIIPEIHWEARYSNGSILSSEEGGKYEEIDRELLAGFSILLPTIGSISIRPLTGQKYHNLVYRIRNYMRTDGSGEREIIVGYPTALNPMMNIIGKGGIRQAILTAANNVRFREEELKYYE